MKLCLKTEMTVSDCACAGALANETADFTFYSKDLGLCVCVVVIFQGAILTTIVARRFSANSGTS